MSVPYEIVEESVAQIASAAYSATRGFPPIRDESGSIDPKAKILTFKSSIAEAGRGKLIPGDRLSVAIDVISENDREVAFVYEAWNSTRMDVLRGKIEGSIVPFRLLKRIVG